MPFTESDLINNIAAVENTIPGVKQSYGFAQNPDNITGLYPCVIHYIPNFKSQPRALHNVWANTINLTSILFVTPRQLQGGRLKFVENAAIPFGGLWRTKFQTDSVISSLLASTGSVKCWITDANYGNGGALLQYGGQDFCGWIFRFQCINA